MSHSSSHRPIRSFVIRAGRMTPRQTQAYDEAWPQYGLTPKGMLDLKAVFQRTAPIVIEIGFGMGQSLVALAKHRQDVNFIGIEVHPPGIGACMADAKLAGLTNLKIIQEDAITVLTSHVADHSVDQIQLLFPDPWHKKRHHKRRIIQPSFLQLVHQKLITGGFLRIATDWQPYADVIQDELDQQTGFIPAEHTMTGLVEARLGKTKFEQRGQRLGHDITDFVYQSL